MLLLTFEAHLLLNSQREEQSLNNDLLLLIHLAFFEPGFDIAEVSLGQGSVSLCFLRARGMACRVVLSVNFF